MKPEAITTVLGAILFFMGFVGIFIPNFFPENFHEKIAKLHYIFFSILICITGFVACAAGLWHTKKESG